ncbi:conserved hypothetical/unknown signal peptide protein [Pelagibacterium halotolerans B2]|uniref:Uncharacterized protein n=2 Tax=Pelagibacterium TaxID=1082930 RepID=G4R7R8_PELHB|nr:conserved hypothetical/unknown signal peptide protein [Pelagibacterium halotolerans B2]
MFVMSLFSRRTLFALGAVVSLCVALPALAHHGWSWASEDWFELEGTLTDLYIGQPHPTVTLNDGQTDWTVELAPVQRTLAAGFDETVVAIGDTVIAHGHRALDESDYRMKAVRLVIGDATYDVYPEFAAELDQ